jgi:hypothetical protein
MVGSRTATAAAGLLGSILLSVLLWWYFDTLAVFLFVPFVPFLLRRSGGDDREESVRECPVCGFRTRSNEFAYCPRDGTELE